MRSVEFGPNAIPFEHYREIGYLRTPDLAASMSIEDHALAYPELARTKAALFTQAYIHGGDRGSWELLTGSQDETVRLTPQSYLELNTLSQQAMPDPESYVAVELGNTIHDVFKNRALMSIVGLGPDDNHDDALLRLFEPEYRQVRQQYFPSLESATERQLYLIEGMLRGNFIRFVQSQASEGEISSLAQLPRDQLYCAIMHGIHDLGGARGDKGETTSLTLDEPAAVRLLDAAEALLITPAELGLQSDTIITPHMRRIMYMQLRAKRLNIPFSDSVAGISELPAKLTVADLLRCYDAKDFAGPHAAFSKLPLLLRIAWANIQAAPIQYPDKSDLRFEGMGTEYAPAFLRTFGRGEGAMYRALGCFAQIQLHAHSLPVAIASSRGDEWPVNAPYTKINLYHLTQSFQNEVPDLTTPVQITYGISEGSLIPKLASESDHRTGYAQSLFHPDVYKVDIRS